MDLSPATMARPARYERSRVRSSASSVLRGRLNTEGKVHTGRLLGTDHWEAKIHQSSE